ncbi:tyrosine-protein phosphatase [Bacteroidales bacterium OttesenSCG-928-M11]|nr:tyrosine-protein phosphatase [Bacteroidales bacterium OttesenSCG-928-M11]
MKLNAANNFRDLGGIRTQDGRTIKINQLFRSDDLHLLTDEDLISLEKLPLYTIVDFRSEGEEESLPDKLPSGLKNIFKFPMSPGNVSDLSSVLGGLSQGVDFFMEQMYITLISDPDCLSYYEKFFVLLQNEDNIPLVFHCSAGKDRTGIAAALILFALGVEEETIMSNYLESNIHLEKKYGNSFEEYPQFKDMFFVKPNYLLAALSHIKTNHGSVLAFLEKVLKVNIKRLQEIYLN